jgi:RNase H-like domain found in reverse transcriptase
LNYIQKYIKDYGRLVDPLYSLLKNSKLNLEWDTTHQNILKLIQSFISPEEYLKHYDSERQLVMFTDASETAIGGHLDQTRKTIQNSADFDSLESKTILFFTQILTPAQRNYSTIEKEFFAIYVGLQKFRYLIRGSSKTLLIVTDHSNIVQFEKYNLQRKRHFTWSEEINSHPCNIYHVKGQNNGFADGLSRMLTTNEEQ